MKTQPKVTKGSYCTKEQIANAGWKHKCSAGDYHKFVQASEELYWNAVTTLIIGVWQIDKRKENAIDFQKV